MSGNSTRTLNIMAFAQRGKHRKDTCPTTVRVVNDVAVDSHLRCALDEYNDTAGRKKNRFRLENKYQLQYFAHMQMQTYHTHTQHATHTIEKRDYLFIFSLVCCVLVSIFCFHIHNSHIHRYEVFRGESILANLSNWINLFSGMCVRWIVAHKSLGMWAKICI